MCIYQVAQGQVQSLGAKKIKFTILRFSPLGWASLTWLLCFNHSNPTSAAGDEELRLRCRGLSRTTAEPGAGPGLARAGPRVVAGQGLWERLEGTLRALGGAGGELGVASARLGVACSAGDLNFLSTKSVLAV